MSGGLVRQWAILLTGSLCKTLSKERFTMAKPATVVPEQAPAAPVVAPAPSATEGNVKALEGVQASVLAAKATSRLGFIFGLVGAKIRKDGKVI